MDLGTGIALLGGKDLIVKVFGKTAEYLGDGLETFTKKRVETVKAIIDNCAKKLGGRMEETEYIPPRVLKEVLDEGSYVDNQIAIEYYGGVLASSRTSLERDDRGKFFSSLISRLSSYQLRTHYIFYHIVKSVYAGSDLKMSLSDDRRKMFCFVKLMSFVHAMDLAEMDIFTFGAVLSHSIAGLVKEGLIEEHYAYSVDGKDFSIFKGYEPEIKEPGIIFKPSVLGSQLFMWVYGYPNRTENGILRNINDYALDSSIKLEKTMYGKVSVPS